MGERVDSTSGELVQVRDLLLLCIPPCALVEIIQYEKSGRLTHHQARRVFNALFDDNLAKLLKAIDLVRQGRTVEIIGNTTGKTYCILTPP